MLSSLAVGYLFLGGVGAGAFFAVQVIDLRWVHTELTAVARGDLFTQRPAERCLSASSLLAFVALVAGIACLLLDLGRADRVLELFVRPTVSFLPFGAYALSLLAICGGALAFVHCAYVPGASERVIFSLKLATAVLSLAVVTYAGLMLMTLPGVALWRTPFVPVLFVLSSLSCGLALVLVTAALGERDAQMLWLMRRLALLDGSLISLELVAVAAFAAASLADAGSAASQAAFGLFAGSQAQLWWIGFALCGLVVPLAVEAMAVRRMRRECAGNAFPRVGMMLCVAALVLTGGFCLRMSMVSAGQHRALELQEPLAVQVEEFEGETEVDR